MQKQENRQNAKLKSKEETEKQELNPKSEYLNPKQTPIGRCPPANYESRGSLEHPL